jgi:hypothetical protein
MRETNFGLNLLQRSFIALMELLGRFEHRSIGKLK